MTRAHRLAALAPMLGVTLAASPADAQDRSGYAEVRLYDYTEGRGSRWEGVAGGEVDLGKATLAVQGRVGERDFGDGNRVSGQGVRGDLFVQWNDWLTTRAIAEFSSDDPTFLNRRLGGEVRVKPIDRVVIAALLSQDDYFRDGGFIGGEIVDLGTLGVTSYGLSGTYFFDGASIRYQYLRSDIDDFGETDSHALSLLLRDSGGSGRTVLSAATGTALNEDDIRLLLTETRQTILAVRREQPLLPDLALILGIDYRSYDSDLGGFDRLGGTLGVRAGF